MAAFVAMHALFRLVLQKSNGCLFYMSDVAVVIIYAYKQVQYLKTHIRKNKLSFFVEYNC